MVAAPVRDVQFVEGTLAPFTTADPEWHRTIDSPRRLGLSCGRASRGEPMNKMILASRRVLSNYATFSGRASRPELWWWFLTMLIVLILTEFVDALLVAPLLGIETVGDEDPARPLSWLVSLAVILPNLAVGARRLHDIGRSGWWLLVGFIPVIGTLILIYFYVQPSDPERNEYGPPTRLQD